MCLGEDTEAQDLEKASESNTVVRPFSFNGMGFSDAHGAHPIQLCNLSGKQHGSGGIGVGRSSTVVDNK